MSTRQIASGLIVPAWFDYLKESFSYKEIQFKRVCPPVKTNIASLLKTLISLLMERASHNWSFSAIGCYGYRLLVRWVSGCPVDVHFLKKIVLYFSICFINCSFEQTL